MSRKGTKPINEAIKHIHIALTKNMHNLVLLDLYEYFNLNTSLCVKYVRVCGHMNI